MVQCFSVIYELGESQKGCLHVHGGKTILKDQRSFRLVYTHIFVKYLT